MLRNTTDPDGDHAMQQLILNEVLSLNAQEFLPAHGGPITAWSSMKS